MISLNLDSFHLPRPVCEDSRVSIGAYTYGNPSLKLWGADERISIGKFCSIAENVTIFGGGEHRTDWVTTFPLNIAFGLDDAWQNGIPFAKGPTIIGNDVWIGYGAILLSGVTVGDGAVIGAGAVVSKNVSPYAIVAGNPASLFRYRFSEEQIQKLLEIKWWDWPLEKIREAVPSLCGGNIDDFLKMK